MDRDNLIGQSPCASDARHPLNRPGLLEIPLNPGRITSATPSDRRCPCQAKTPSP